MFGATLQKVAAVVGLRERKKEKTRDALFRSALKQFTKRGFDHVTVEDIAGACDVSPRTFFRYFASKEDVLFAQSDGQRAQLLASIADQPAGLSAFEALAASMRFVATDYTAQRDVLRARHRIIRATPSLRTRVAERQQGWEGEIADQLRASGRVGRLSDVELRLVVAATTTALRVAVESWIDDGTGDLEALLDTVLGRLRRGFA